MSKAGNKKIDRKIAQLLFRVKQNQLKMVARRGYSVSKQEQGISRTTVNNFLKAYIPFAEAQNKTLRQVLTIIYEQPETSDKLLVYYADVTNNQMGVKIIQTVAKIMNEKHIRNAIIITPKSPHATARKEIEGLVAYNIQIFLEEEMAFDPTEHMFVPQHILLTEEETTDLLLENGINLDQLPIILSDDIMVRYYGGKAGQIFKIIRTNMFETAIERSISYRVIKYRRYKAKDE